METPKGNKWVPPMKGHNYDHGKGDVCRKCGKTHKHLMLGKPLTASHKLKVSMGLKKSKVLRKSISDHYEEKAKRFLRAPPRLKFIILRLQLAGNHVHRA